MSTTSATSPSLDLAVSMDKLTNASELKKLIVGDAKPIFNFGAQIAPYWDSAVQRVPNGTSATITVSGSGEWKTSGIGIGFALSGSAKGQLKVVTSGPVLNYAPDLKSQPTSVIPETPYPGSAYIVVSLGFEISGSATGSGNVNGLGISGNVKGSADTSVVFSHKVSGSTNLSDAIRETFETFVFALEPNCAKDMDAGDVAQTNFNGSLAFGLDVSYGIANVSFAGPGVASVLDSVTRATTQFNLPSGKLDVGADASVSYTHRDDFTAIVQKLDRNQAFLYVMRAHKNEEVEGLKLSASVTITNTPGVTINSQKLDQAVNSITGVGGELATACATDIAQGLSGKLDSWINNTVSKGAILGAEWDQQQAASMLFKYGIDLANADLVNLSWNALCGGSVRDAVSRKGLIRVEGSGISRQMSDSFTLSVQFFNLFAASDKSTYFKKTNVTVTQNGDLRYLYDIGKESDVDVNKSKDTCLIHFVATVDQTNAHTVSSAEVDLELELIATNNQKEAGRIGDVVGLIPPMQEVNQAQKAMQQFVASNHPGTLHLVCVLKPSAYGRLSCSEYTGKRPPANQQQDSENWSRFHDASVALLDLEFVEDLTYKDWQAFNAVCVYGYGVRGTPDRRSEGNPAAVLPHSWPNINADARLVSYFMVNSADFMNMCDDLHQLAGLASVSNNSAEDITSYNTLLMSLLELIVKRDVNTDYSKPAIAAILKLSNPQKVTTECVSVRNALTCTLTLS